MYIIPSMNLEEAKTNQEISSGLSSLLYGYLGLLQATSYRNVSIHDAHWAHLIEPRNRLVAGLTALTSQIDELSQFRWKANFGVGNQAKGESIVFSPSHIGPTAQKPYLVLLFDRYPLSVLENDSGQNFSCYFALGSGTRNIKFDGPGKRPRGWAQQEMKRRRDLMYEVGIKYISPTASNFIAVGPNSTELIGDGSIDETFTAIDALGFKYSLSQRLDDGQLREQILAMVSMYLEGDLEDLPLNGETRVNERERIVLSPIGARSMNLQKEIRDLIKRGKRSFILSGAPGVGKTVAAHSIVRGILSDLNPRLDEEDLSELVRKQTLDLQFHPAYSYEDFIEGLRPKSEAGGVVFEVEPGRLLESIGWIDNDQSKLIIETEVSQTEIEKYLVFKQLTPNLGDKLWDLERDGLQLKPFFVVIDEINRANLPRVFGELLGLIEDSKRGRSEYAVKLPSSGKRFLIPPHVIFIGTMNSADRSIRHLDAALMRRFTLLNIPIDVSNLEKAWESFEALEISPLQIANGLARLNEEIAQKFNERQEGVDERQVGPSYLWPNPFEPIFDKEFVEARFKYSITPLLIEFLGADGQSLATKYVDGFPETWR